MSRKKKEAVIFVINIGKTSAESDKNEIDTFLDKTKNAVRQVMERKIFLRKDDLINVVCIGANETENEEMMDYIKHLETELLVPTWELVDNILKLESTNKTSVWVEGLHVALEFIKKKCTGIEVIPKVMVINDFQEDPSIIQQFEAESIAKEILTAQAQLMIVGKTLNNDEDTPDFNLSEQLAWDVCKRVDGFYAQIDKFLWESRFYKNPSVKPSPWRCDLRIGDVKIPTETYVKITEPPPFPSWQLTTRDNLVGFPPKSSTDVKKEKQLVDPQRNTVEKENAIIGYKYGGKFIPFSEEDQEETKFKGTQKSLIVRGFVKRSELSLEYWFGKGSHVIVARQDNASKAKFYSLLTAMKNLDQVAIVRRVYQTNSIPKMGVLFPRMEEGEPVCLVLISIPFAEERRILKKRQKVSLPSEKQQQDVEDFIDAMTLPEDDDRFKPGSFCNPCKQYKWDNLAHRALNRVPLPPMEKALMDLISPPESLVHKAESALKRIAQWVEPKVEVKKSKAEKVNLDTVKDETQKTDEDLIKAAEEAEEEMRKKDELFDEISEATMAFDEDLLNEM